MYKGMKYFITLVLTVVSVISLVAGGQSEEIEDIQGETPKGLSFDKTLPQVNIPILVHSIMSYISKTTPSTTPAYYTLGRETFSKR